MIRYLYADQLADFPKLAETMFRDRACQFKERLGWDVEVDDNGFERDQYDDLKPLYVIWENADGTHGGSYRLLPTTGNCMVNDHFTHVMDGSAIRSPFIWECTRFCLSKGAPSHVAAALVLAGAPFVQEFGIRHVVGVFDARMVRIYRMIGSSPEVLGSIGEGRDQISVGLWEFAQDAEGRVSKVAGISPEQIRHWFDLSFGSKGADMEPLAMTA
ncbi:acyl-homoserine-lactone synthase [Primorskyibacter sp. S187A]|uniref:acyl-homoserine-lactone synthase n=1 Tax=Primorskyibacter sp. S187A TaxID=3415130 RepID=UPI003C7D795C